MSAQRKKDTCKVCPKTGRKLHAKKTHNWIQWGFPVVGLASLIWFLVRVVPKPSRATYPCQRVAAPLAGGFILWIAGLMASALGYHKAKDLIRRSRLAKAMVWLTIAAVAAVIAIVNMPGQSAIAEDVIPNAPMGTGKGIYPGRVVWAYNPDATDWDGTNDTGQDIGDGYWWESNHTNQTVVDDMMSRSLRALAGKSSDAAAWNAIFRHFNQNTAKGDIDYQPGEKITIKINMVTANRDHDNIDAEGNQTTHLGWVNTSPQMIVALLRQLVNVVGVEPADITVGDTTCYFPNHYWDYCHSYFPDVHYLACSSNWGRRGAVSSQGQSCQTPVYWSTSGANGKAQDYLPVSYAEAAYLINMACLKGHSSGITLCAKNHYGSFIRLPYENPYYDLHLSLPNPGWSPGMAHYRAHVDIIGHPKLGGKTLLYLIDGLYGGYYWEGRPYKWNMTPFNGDWPSSLFASQDPVAIDSVAHDFLLEEWPRVTTGGTGDPGDLEGGQEDYLHEAALADDPCSGTFYDPNNDGSGLTSLGVHEHWNNPVSKQYTRNLGTGNGIELISLTGSEQEEVQGDLDGDGHVDAYDLAMMADYWLGCTFPNVTGCESVIPSMTIIPGSAVVDGYLDEWADHPEWISLDKVYFRNPADITEARFAVRWDQQTDRAYLAVIVDDTSHVFTDAYDRWNASDRIGIFSQGDAQGGLGWAGLYDVAQHYVIGPDNAAGSWAYWADGQTLGPDAQLQYAVRVDGSEIIYEAAIKQFDNYGGISGGPTVVTGLSLGHNIAFDVVVYTRGWCGFGQLAANTMLGKANNADQFARYELVEELPGQSCGDWGYFDADLDKNCRVNLQDLAIMAGFWLADIETPTEVVAPGAELVEVYSDNVFFEGPCWDPAGQKLYFVAYSPMRILRLDSPGSATVWMNTGNGVNGTFIADDGRMLTAEIYTHKIMSYQIGETGPQDPVEMAHDDSWLQPNDLCQSPAGDIYFTDPQWAEPHTQSAVYRRAQTGQVTKVIYDMLTPNGIITSNDGTTLYVADSTAKEWRAYTIHPDGSIGSGRLFFKPASANPDVPDGMTIDEYGNVYMTGMGGVWVAAPNGDFVTMIPTPETASNATFGGPDGKTLYITCDKKVYSLQMLVRGGRFLE